MTIHDEILALENKFWRSMIDKNSDVGAQLTAEPCIVAGAQGVSRIDRKTFAKMMETGNWLLRAYEFSDVKVELITSDVAVIAYKVREELTVDGKELTMEAADASTWSARATAGCARCTPNPCSATRTAATARHTS